MRLSLIERRTRGLVQCCMAGNPGTLPVFRCAPERLPRWPGRFADDQLRLHCDLWKTIAVCAPELLEQRPDRQCSHLVKRLANRGETRGLEGGLFDIVEAHHRNILRYS